MTTMHPQSAVSTRPLGARARVLVALGAASLALFAAAPAHAVPEGPVNKDGKKSCGIVLGIDKDGEAIAVWVDHGGTKTNPDGSRYKCDDGLWVGAKLTPTNTFGATSGTYYDGASGTPATYGSTSGTYSHP